MDKRRLRVALKVLDEVRICYLDIKKFVEDLTDEECQKD